MFNFILSFLLLFGTGVQSSLQKTLNRQNGKFLENRVADEVILVFKDRVFIMSGPSTCLFFAGLAKSLPIKTATVYKVKKRKSLNPLQVSPPRYSHYILFKWSTNTGTVGVKIYIMTFNGKIVKIRL